jgi:hypothetical protein
VTGLREQMQEERRLRDAARALIDADLRNLRTDLSTKSLGERAVDRIVGGASDVYDEAIEVASDHKGALAAILAALALWFARHPILEAFFDDDGQGRGS